MGLNSLQDPWMVIHPPIVFAAMHLGRSLRVGHVGTCRGRLPKWVKPALPWTVQHGSFGDRIIIGQNGPMPLWVGAALGWDPVETPP